MGGFFAVVSKEGTYGYKITQDVRTVMEVPESTLYPVLRRLKKDGYLETYDVECNGRNRRYYKITSNGMILLDTYRREWIAYQKSIDQILTVGDIFTTNYDFTAADGSLQEAKEAKGATHEFGAHTIVAIDEKSALGTMPNGVPGTTYRVIA